MLVPATVAVIAVALGLLLALTAGARAIGPVRTFALAAALTVVLVHLLPEAVAELGPLAILGLVAGFAVPAILDRAGHGVLEAPVDPARVPHGRLALELGYAGLLVHHVGDGLALWLFGTADRSSLDVLVALAAHTVPLTALVALRFRATHGAREGVLRAVGLAVASLVGVLAGGRVPEALVRTADPWISAVVSGLLLHFLSHDLDADAPRTTWQRALDLAALAAGIGVTAAGAIAHDRAEGERSPLLMLGPEIGRLAAQVAPWLLGGLLIEAILRVTGAPLPLRIWRRWPRAGIALQIFGPALHPTGIAVAIGILGPIFAAAWIGGVVSVAIIATALAGSIGAPPLATRVIGDGLFSRALAALDVAVAREAPAFVAALIAAAALGIGLADDALSSLAARGRDVPIAIVAMLLLPGSAAGVVLVGAALVASGLSSAALLSALIVGSAGGASLITKIRGTHGARAANVAGAVLVLVAVAAGALARGRVSVVLEEARDPGPVGIAAAVALGAILLRDLWRAGARAWIAGIIGMSPGGAHSHSHGADPCDHDHDDHDGASESGSSAPSARAEIRP